MRCVWNIFSPVRFRRATDVCVQWCAILSVTAALVIVDQRRITEAENVRINDVVDSPFGADFNDTYNDVNHQFRQGQRNDKSSPLIPEDHVRPSKLHFRKRQPSETGPSAFSTWNAATGNEFLDAGDDEEDSNEVDDSVQYSAETGIELASNPLQRRFPQAIIIGVKKGGTRALLEFLKAHPDVRAPNPEIHFFDRHYDRGLEWYRKQMPLTTENQLTIEKTPSYFITKLAPSRVYNMSLMMENEVGRSGGVRLIVVVRDPVTRAVSDYTQAAAKRPDLEPFDQLAFLDSPRNSDLSATSKFRQQRDDEPLPPPRVVDTSWGAIKIGLYARHLERWLRFFPPNRIHFVHGERLVVDPAGELALVQDFLGLRRLVTAEMFHFNATKGFPCLLRRQTPPPAPTSSTLPSTSLRPEMNLSSSSASLAFGSNSTFNRTLSSFSLRCLGKTKGRVHPAIDAVVLQRLRDFYRPFNEKFYAMTRINFGWL